MKYWQDKDEWVSKRLNEMLWNIGYHRIYHPSAGSLYTFSVCCFSVSSTRYWYFYCDNCTYQWPLTTCGINLGKFKIWFSDFEIKIWEVLEVFPTRHRSRTRWFTEINHRQRCRAWLSTEIKPDQSRLPYYREHATNVKGRFQCFGLP